MDFTPHTEAEIAEMLQVIGVRSLADLFGPVPQGHLVQGLMDLPGPETEAEVMAHMEELAQRNTAAPCFIGAGAYDHYIPAAVHHLIERGEFLTSYTPYQPEYAQGTLMAQFEYQTMVASLLGMDVANASMYEAGTALAEACLMACRHTRRPRVLVARAVHPEYRAVLKTYVGQSAVTEIPFGPDGATDQAALALSDDVACVVIQSPNFFGVVEDLAAFAKTAHHAGALLIATFSEPLAFGLLEPPGSCGADVAAGEGQSLGLPLAFGGPYIGLFAVKSEFVKAMPGRLVGMARDANGKRCFTLTLAAREQHIRRERASSNICTNEGLCAVAVAIYLSLLGRDGLPRLAAYNHHRAERLKAALMGIGLHPVFSGPTFNEFVVRVPSSAAAVADAAAMAGVLAGFPLGRAYPELDDCLLVTVTEKRTDADFELLLSVLSQLVACP